MIYLRNSVKEYRVWKFRETNFAKYTLLIRSRKMINRKLNSPYEPIRQYKKKTYVVY